jgi:hypothetical protein
MYGNNNFQISEFRDEVERNRNVVDIDDLVNLAAKD